MIRGQGETLEERSSKHDGSTTHRKPSPIAAAPTAPIPLLDKFSVCKVALCLCGFTHSTRSVRHAHQMLLHKRTHTSVNDRYNQKDVMSRATIVDAPQALDDRRSANIADPVVA